MSRVVVLPVLLVLLASLAGCFGDDTLSASGPPVWSPGHTWTWDVTSTEAGRLGSESLDDTEEGTLTQLVVGKAPLDDGAELYWVQTSGTSPGLLPGRNLIDDADVLFVDPSDLSVTETAWGDLHPCGGGQISIREDDPEAGGGHLDLVRFPLGVGRSWSGDVQDLTYDARVIEQEQKTTPAGTFDTLRIDVTFTVPPDGRKMLTLTEQRTSIWYAPKVEHIVAVAVNMRATIEAEGLVGSIAVDGQLALKSYQLAERTDTVLPEIRGQVPRPDPSTMGDDANAEATRYRIAWRGDEEPNIADGPFSATFGITEGEGYGHVGPAEAVLDGAAVAGRTGGKTLRWRIVDERGDEGVALGEKVGATMDHTFEEGGRYTILVDAVEPDDANRPCASDPIPEFRLRATLDVYRRETYTREYAAGAAPDVTEIATIGLDDLTFLRLAVEVTQATDDPTLPPQTKDLRDDGRLLLLPPDGGEAIVVNETHDEFIRTGGTWKIVWEPRGKATPLGQYVPILTGHKITVDVSVYWR